MLSPSSRTKDLRGGGRIFHFTHSYIYILSKEVMQAIREAKFNILMRSTIKDRIIKGYLGQLSLYQR